MNKIFFCIIFILLAIGASCKDLRKPSKTDDNKTFNDSIYVLYPDYEVGDSRRYGVFPDSTFNNYKHPNTNMSRMHTLIDFAQDYDGTIFFSKGYYQTNLIMDSKQNIDFKFDKAEFNLLHITNEKGQPSHNITLRGTLVLYDRLGTYNSHNIKIDSVIIKTNEYKNLAKQKSRGCHIYKGTDTLSIKYLEVHDLASGSEIYKNNHAALAIDGLRNNPTHVSIDEVYIKSSDRHGAYITGSNHIFKKIKIEKYAQGTTEGMTGMQDSDPGEELEFSGLWINRCNDCQFDNVDINTKLSRNYYPLKLDEGNIGRPTFIDTLTLDVKYKDTLVLDNVLTNILVKKIITID
ncbi:hypothetical protein [Winogradskyella sp. SM1960]|uniref:hypothetical protein n=1 Tax=Winogradskyella sp. SM1960 TaxID=2865955 RepID=UPI001CD3A5A8|nr:hypothetical protein [Winogradskyella sp. SM1960]